MMERVETISPFLSRSTPTTVSASDDGVTIVPSRTESKPSQFNHLALLYIVIFANIGTLLFGYEVGSCTWIIYIIYQNSLLDDDMYKYDSTVYNDSWLLGLIGGGAALGAMLIFPLCVWVGNRVSKRDEIMVAAVLYFIGGVLISISSGLNWHYRTGYSLLVLGRVIYGCGVGATLHSIPQYISEIAPSQIRGQYGSSIEVMIMLGIMLGYAVGYVYGSNNSWTETFIVAYCGALGMGLLSLVLPHDPIWMIHNKLPESEVLESIKFICPDATKENIQVFRENMAQEARYRSRIEKKLLLFHVRHGDMWMFQSGIYDLLPPPIQLCLHDRSYRRCLLVMIGIPMAKVFSGQPVILCYASTFFSSILSSYVDSMVFGFILMRTVVAFVMLIFGEVVGRRKFLNTSCVVMTISMLIAGISALYEMNITALVFIFISGFAFQFGYASLSHILMNEVCPYYLRSTATAVANLGFFSLNFVVTFLFPYMWSTFGTVGLLFLFAGLNIGCFFFTYLLIPETQGLDLDVSYKEVNQMFESLACCSSMKKTPSGNFRDMEEDDEVSSLDSSS
jgi:MFS family permease